MGENNRLLQDILRSKGDIGLRSVALEAYSAAQLIRAALDTLAKLLPNIPLTTIGYSFGAAIGLRAVTGDARVQVQCALGLPLQLEFPLDFLHESSTPLLIVQGENDKFGSPEALQQLAAELGRPVEIQLIEAAGHLFVGHEDAAVDAVVGYLARRFS